MYVMYVPICLNVKFWLTGQAVTKRELINETEKAHALSFDFATVS